MKIFNINLISFKGQREDRKTVSQLKSDNPYDLNLINQRRIAHAIDSLSEIPGEDNVEFLLDVSENLKYGTRIDLNKASFNDWSVKLDEAVKKSLAKSSYDVQQKFAPRIEKLHEQKELSDDEKEILKLRESILHNVDYEALNDIKSDNIRNLDSNLDYFIVSSEVPLSQKLYIMRRLNHFMSPDYKINEQLQDKKTQALAEIVNDIVVDTPESKIPNIKAINQKQHGMCAAISICRKLLAYEDKANFVDMILSELDNSNAIEAYDINKLGSKEKIKLQKTNVDFNYALSKGYRIIDTSALYWMHIADTAGINNEQVGMYMPFDKDLFDTFHDSHFIPDSDAKTSANQDYYRAILKSKEALNNIKKQKLVSDYKRQNESYEKQKNVELIKKYDMKLIQLLSEISPEMSKSEIRQIKNDLLNLEVKDSLSAKKSDKYNKNFVYLPNETAESKLEKVKAFLSVSMPEKDSKLLNKNAKQIVSLLNEINKINKNDESLSYQSKQIKRAKSLYAAAAAYRTQMLMRLLVPEEKNEAMINFGLPDRETAIIRNMNMLINKLEQEVSDRNEGKVTKNKLDSRIKSVLAKNFQAENDEEILIEALKENKKSMEYIMTDLLDEYYRSILSVSRKNVLLNEVKVIQGLINDDDEETIETLSNNIGIHDDKELLKSILGRYVKTLSSENCTNDEFTEIYNSIGKKSQMQDFADTMNELYKSLFIEKNPKVIPGFNLLNGLPADAPLEETLNVFNKIGEYFNNVSNMTSSMQNALEVKTPDGIILNTVIPDEIIIKKLENNGEIIPARDLKILQERFTKIDNAMSEVNGETVTIKDLPKDLVTLTKREKEILDRIERNINAWQKQTNRNLDTVYRRIKEPLSEVNRKVGVKTGQNVVWTEGESGLSNEQEVRIIEYMTGRPYYVDKNLSRALSKIKENSYSGISSTSVSDKEPAWHAQYIADIKPLQVRNKKGNIETKDALMHDNSWGPSEHENVWVDKNGMLRTDYARRYGGELGFITDEKYLSGKLVENLVGQVGVWSANGIDSKQYKRLSHRADFDIKFPMISAVITQGQSPGASTYVKMLRENALISSNLFFDDLDKYAKSMTRAQIEEVIKKTETIGVNLQKEFDDIEQRIFGNPPFDKGIATQQDYDNLKDNDPIKVLFEKIALIDSYSDIPDSKVFYGASSLAEINKFKSEVRKEARKNFDYSFANNKDFAIYATERSRQMLTTVINHFASENNFELKPDDVVKIINSMKHIKDADFDGRLDTTAKLMADSFATYFAKNTPDFDDKKIKIENLREDTRRYVRKNMDIKVEDLEKSSFKTSKMKKIEHWIDENFDPKSDEEFVQIYNKLRSMSKKEFNEKYNSKIKDSDLGILPVTGFDVVKKFRAIDERTENKIFNMLYSQHLGESLKLSKMRPSYEYNIFERVLRGAYFPNGNRTFDDIYFDYYYSLFMLTMQDKLSKFRTQAFKQYGAFPAYPVMEYEDMDELSGFIQDLEKNMKDSFENISNYKSMETSCKIVSDLRESISEFSASEIIPIEKRQHITELLEEFLYLNKDDESIKDTIDAANKMLEFGDNVSVSDYKPLINKMYKEVNFYAKTADGKSLKDSISDEVKIINNYKKDFVENNFPEKYHAKAYKLLNQWTTASINDDPNADDIYRIDFTDLYHKHRLGRTPEKMLNEYLLKIAKNEKNEINKAASKKYMKDLNEKIQKMEKGELAHSKKELKALKEEYKKLSEEKNVIDTFRANLKGFLTSADRLELEYILMDCAKDANLNIVREDFKKSKIPLRNDEIVEINSPKALNMIILPMILGDNFETAMKFVNELGLNEGVAKMLIESSHNDNVKKCFERIDNIFTSVSEQISFANEQREKLSNLDNDPNYLEKIEEFRRAVMKKCRQTHYPKTADIFSKGIDDALKSFERHPKSSKTAYLYLHMDNTKDAIVYLARNEVERINSQLIDFQKIVDFARKLNIPEDSPVRAEFDKFLKELAEIDEIALQHAKNYEELNLSTIAAL